MIERAFVLAAGLGTRMRPLTLKQPKPLLQIAGKTLLDHTLDHLLQAEVKEVVINCHYHAQRIIEHVSSRTSPRIFISYEKTLLETGGAIKHALQYFDHYPFYTVNTDILWQNGTVPALKRLAATWNDSQMDTLLLLVERGMSVGYEGPGNYLKDPQNRLTPSHASEAFIFTGLSLVHPRIYYEVAEGHFSNTILWDRAAEKGRLFGLIHDNFWYHIGTPTALRKVNSLFEV